MELHGELLHVLQGAGGHPLRQGLQLHPLDVHLQVEHLRLGVPVGSEQVGEGVHPPGLVPGGAQHKVSWA